MNRPPLDRAAVERSQALDRAAAARQDAQAAQERASYLCLGCRAPDGAHAGSCPLPRKRNP